MAWYMPMHSHTPVGCTVYITLFFSLLKKCHLTHIVASQDQTAQTQLPLPHPHAHFTNEFIAMFSVQAFAMPQIHSNPSACLGTSLYLQHSATVTEFALKYLLLCYPSFPEEQREVVKEMSRETVDLRVGF